MKITKELLKEIHEKFMEAADPKLLMMKDKKPLIDYISINIDHLGDVEVNYYYISKYGDRDEEIDIIVPLEHLDFDNKELIEKVMADNRKLEDERRIRENEEKLRKQKEKDDQEYFEYLKLKKKYEK